MSILKPETLKSLLCCSRGTAFNACLTNTITRLVEAGYPPAELPDYICLQQARHNTQHCTTSHKL